MKKFDKDKYLRKLKFKRLWSKYQRYVYLGVSCLVIAVLGIYFSHSKFTTTSEEDVIRTTVGNFIYGDVIATPYIDGEYSLTFPEKKTGINVEKIVCDNDTSASWDEEKWGLMVTNLSKRTKCNIYFVTPASCGINDNVSCISSREELATLATEVNNGDNKSGKIIYLTSDLDLGGKFDSNGNALDGNISWTPIGSEAKPFSGTFDGNGHIITNMYINETGGTGLFLMISKGKVKNLGIEKSYVKSSEAGASLLAYKIVNSKVSNTFINGTVSGQGSSAGFSHWSSDTIFNNVYNAGIINSNNKQFAGGILGYALNVTIKNAYNYGNIASNCEDGGIVGGFQGTKLEYCYNFGQIDGWNAGGIVGSLVSYTYPEISNSYNSGIISGGGIVGSIFEDKATYKLSNNYYLQGTASYGINSSKSNTDAEPLTEDQMPSVISVINGDNAFAPDTNNINNGYPILKWQAERENN